jgi:hypothetical protein
MSARTRFFLILPAMLIASWLAMRSPAADAARDPAGDPPLSTATREIDDPALAALIARFAAEARDQATAPKAAVLSVAANP